MPKAGQVRKLTDIETLGVALVTRGANRKKWAVTKGDEGEDMTITQLIAQVIQKGEMPVDESALDKMCEQAGLDKQAAETFKAVVKLASAYKDSPAMQKMLKDELPKVLGMKGGEAPPQGEGDQKPPAPKDEGQDGGGGNSAGASEGDNAAQGDGEKEKDKMSTQKGDTTPAAQQPAAGAKDDVVKADVAKAQAEVAELKTLLTKQADDFKAVMKSMQDTMDKERDERLKSEWLAKAEKDLAFVPGKTTAELGAMLFDIEKKVSKEMAETQFGVLKASSQSLQKSDLFRPSGTQGKGADGQADALTQLLAKADVVLEKSDILKGEGTTEMHKARAVAKSLELHPQLYAQYLNDNPAQRGNRFYSQH